jgi:hypothetical protein
MEGYMIALTRVRPYADETSLERAGGHQIDWSTVTTTRDGKKFLPAGTVVSRKGSDNRLTPAGRTMTITNITVTGGTLATLTVADHGLVVGERIVVAGTSQTALNQEHVVGSVLNANQITIVIVNGTNGSFDGSFVLRRPAIGLLETDASEGEAIATHGGYSVLVGGVVYENLLPDQYAGQINDLWKHELARSGCTFKFVPYRDNRGA